MLPMGIFFLVTIICTAINIGNTENAIAEQEKMVKDQEGISKKKQYYDDETYAINNATEWPAAFKW